MKKARLIKSINILIYFFLVFSNVSCNSEKEKISKSEIINFLKQQNNWNEAIKIYKSMNDSISIWHQKKVEGYNYYSFVNLKIDSLICFNNTNDKILTIKYRQINGNHTYDGYTYFYGVKVKESWYFFDGEYQPVARNDPKIPASFDQLSKIAFEDVFQYYLKRNEKGELEINERIFSSLTDGGWAEGDEGKMPKSKEEWDQRYLREAEKRRAKIDTNNYISKK